MRKWELENLVVAHDESMGKAYDAILAGNANLALAILAEALRLHKRQVTDVDAAGLDTIAMGKRPPRRLTPS